MRKFPGIWKQLILTISLLCLLCGVTKSQTWTAYNDCAGTTGGNTTAYTQSGTTTGLLKNYATGANTPVTVTITKNGSINTYASNGAFSNSGTDAYATFNGKANMAGVINYASSNGWYVDITFTGLDAAETYTFATTANRDDADYTTRNSEFTISGIESCTNASTEGVTVENNETVAFCTGYNTVNGYVARWTNIAPGSDGTFKVRINAYPFSSSYYGYGPSVFMLEEEDNTTPVITTTGTLADFVSPSGTPSSAQTYTVAGKNLTSDISIYAPEGFEISLDDVTYGPSLTLTQSGGTVSSTTLYVRLNSTVLGTYSGNITHTSTGATQKVLSVSGTVAAYYTLTVHTDSRGNVALSPAGGYYPAGTIVTLTATGNTGFTFNSWTGDLSGSTNPALLTVDANKTATADFAEGGISSLVVSEDTHMRSGSSRGKYNYGGSTTIRVNPYYEQGSTDGQLTGALLKWDMSSAGIPAEAQITSASITFYVTTGSNYAYGLYNMKQAWVEGTNNAASGTGASWTYYGAGTGSWGTEGAGSIATDRDDVNLWNATAADFNTTGFVTFNLNSEGINVIEGWINSTLVNNGLTIQNYDGTETDVWEAASSEASTESQRPRLNISYSTSSDPSITLTGTLIDFTTAPGVPSASQSYTISGRHLTSVISVTAPTGFEISEDGTTFTSTLTLTPVDGIIAGKTIYVRMNNSYEASLSGNISHTSTGATQKTMAVSGIVSSSKSESLEASEDTYMSSYNTTNNYGASTTLKSTRNGSSNVKRGTLLRWDLSGIPATAVVTNASLTLYVSTSSSQTYNLYNMRQGWLEGTGASEETKDGATWLTYNGSNTWVSSGAADITNDRYDVNLWDAGTASFSSTGTKTVNLNAQGIAVIQEWINGAVNNGLTIQNYSSSGLSDDLQFASSENTTNMGPTLNLTTRVDAGINHTLTITTDGHGSISLNPAGGTYIENSVVTLTPEPNTGYTFSSWDGANDNDLVDNGNGTWSITMNEDKSLTATFTETAANDAPNLPVLIQPADNGSEISTSPVLQVTVSDPDNADLLDVDFYGRESGATSSADDFTIVVLPDIQNESQYNTEMLNSQMDWIVTQQEADNILFVTSVGDLVNTPSNATQYNNADAAFDRLDLAEIPYSVGPGNHDMMGGTLYNNSNYFGAERFTGKTWYQGHYGSDNFNNYSFFTASENNFILINLQYSPTENILNWADALLKAHSDRRAIVVQHDILNINDSWNNQASFNALKDNPNLFLMLCGHMHSGSDGAAYRAEPGDDGHTIHVVQADYQDFSYGNGYLRILRFSPNDDMIYMTTYSPYAGTALTTDPDQKNLVYDLANGTSQPFAHLESFADVTNGTNVSSTWPGLSENKQYEWYVTVSDGALITNSPVWTFKTGSNVATHILTMSVNGEGATNPSVGTHTYPQGNIVNLTATPAAGSHFVNWTGDVEDDQSPTTTVTIDGPKTVAANFIRDEYTLSVNVSGNGSVVRSPEKTTYQFGDVVQLTATPTSGFIFSGWSGDITETVNPVNITMNTNKSVTATFTNETTQQKIQLLSGWNIFSLNLIPQNSEMMHLLQPLIDANALVKVQDEAGNAFELNTVTGTWIDDITDWSVTEGYKIKVNQEIEWTIMGTPISAPVSIDLKQGWNIMSYPSNGAFSAETILNDLMTKGFLVKVQNQKGDAIERNPGNGEWLDDIGDFVPGEGYKIKVSQNASILIDQVITGAEMTVKSARIAVRDQKATMHFKPIWDGNGLDHMNIYVTENMNGITSLQSGDEIGVFDGDNCVGAGIIENPLEMIYSIVVSADDPTTVQTDGYKEGNPLRLKIWHSAIHYEATPVSMEVVSGTSSTFEPMGTSMIIWKGESVGVNTLPNEITGLGNSYPNPFHASTSIPFTIGAETDVDIAIYSILGARIQTLVHGTLSPGAYTTSWDISTTNKAVVMPGIYLCKMTAGDKVFVIRIEVADIQ